MGRNTTTPNPSSLDRFSVGEIVDIEGVPNLYDAGTSKWVKSNTYVASSAFPDSTKANIANQPNGYNQIVLATTIETTVANQSFASSVEPPARITASNITCYPAISATQAQTVMVVNSDGVQVVTTPLINRVSSQGYLQSVVVSDGTKFFQYGFTASNTLALYTSTNGTTWTSQAMTGVPAFNVYGSVATFYANSNNKYTVGDNYNAPYASSYGSFGVVWCGARFLCFGPSSASGGGGTMLAATSADGYTWSSNAATILGSASIAGAINTYFYRNGNNCLLKVGQGSSTGGAIRYSNDGGITWAAVTVSARYRDLTVGNMCHFRNSSDATKLLAHGFDNSGVITSTSGATFDTNITLPYYASTSGSIAYKGSTILQTYPDAAYPLMISTNDGASFTSVLFPVGTLNNYGAVFSDANRFYFFPYYSGQILTSSDGITWTINTLPTINGNFAGDPRGIIAFDSNKVAMFDGSYVCMTTDGGITWKIMRTQTGGSADVRVGNGYTTPDGGGIAVLGNGYQSTNYAGIVSANSMTAGGSFYKVTSSVISPIRANATAYVRIA